MRRPKPIDRERFLKDDEILVSKTDTRGRITYGNERFIEISGYCEEELLGAPHSIIRHPDMPKAVFKILWDGHRGWGGGQRLCQESGKGRLFLLGSCNRYAVVRPRKRQNSRVLLGQEVSGEVQTSEGRASIQGSSAGRAPQRHGRFEKDDRGDAGKGGCDL